MPSEKLLAPLAESLAADYDISRLAGILLRSNLFFSPTAYRQRVKSPVDFALGIIRPLAGTVSTVHLAEDLAAMGQNLYHPPTVKGWPDSRHWITRYPSLTRLENGGPAHHTDFRCVYAALLDRWLGFDSRGVLGEKHQPANVLRV